WANNYVNHAVFDQTGLTGSYDLSLSWTPRGQLRRVSDDPNATAAISFFDAVEQQLGLKLDAQNMPQSVIVVNHVDQKPSPNPEGRSKPPPVYPTEFEVASIHLVKPGTPDKEDRVLPSGQLEIAGTLKDLIAGAYDLQDYMVFGGPKWLDADRFEVVAKT